MHKSLFVFGLSLMSSWALADYDAVAPRNVDLTGRWIFNAALSDDAGALLQRRIAKQAKRRQREVRAEQGIGPSSNPQADAAQREIAAARSQNSTQALRRMLGVTKSLTITQSDAGAKLEIVSDVETRRFTAGSRSQVSMQQGQLADSEVGWDGDRFVIERKVRQGPRVIEKYRVLKKTDQLETFIAWSGDTFLSGIKVRRLFDRVTDTAPPPDPAAGPVKK